MAPGGEGARKRGVVLRSRLRVICLATVTRVHTYVGCGGAPREPLPALLLWLRTPREEQQDSWRAAARALGEGSGAGTEEEEQGGFPACLGWEAYFFVVAFLLVAWWRPRPLLLAGRSAEWTCGPLAAALPPLLLRRRGSLSL